jgi:hypothetical protein
LVNALLEFGSPDLEVRIDIRGEELEDGEILVISDARSIYRHYRDKEVHIIADQQS